MPQADGEWRIAKNEGHTPKSPWIWHLGLDRKPMTFPNRVAADAGIRDAKREDLTSKFQICPIADISNPDASLPAV